MSKPRLDEVADRAGVSTATVSRYINKSGYVAGATATRIQEAIDALGYRPNLLAGALSTSRSRQVAVIVPQLTHSPFNATIEALVGALSRDGFTAMLGISGPDESQLGSLIDTALARRVDGIILTGTVADEQIRRKLQGAGITIIETWGLPDDPIDLAIGFSHEEIGRATAQFAETRGYRHPLLITARGTRAIQRRNGFVRQWRALEAKPFEEHEVDSPSRFGQARAVFRLIKAADPRPDLVVCGSDGLAQGLLIEAMNAGIAVPDELAIIGFGNLTIAADMRPPITTIAIDGERLGHEAAAAIRSRGEGSVDQAKVTNIGFQLLKRASA